MKTTTLGERVARYRVRRTSKSITIKIPRDEAPRLERTLDWAEQRGHDFLFGRDLLKGGLSHGDNCRVLGIVLAKDRDK
jgi:hypothetical protein